MQYYTKWTWPVGKLGNNVSDCILSGFGFSPNKSIRFIPDLFGRPGKLRFVPTWPDPQYTEQTPSITFPQFLIHSPPISPPWKNWDRWASGLVPSLTRRSELIPTEPKGRCPPGRESPLFPGKASETLSMEGPVSSHRILSGPCCAHRTQQQLWHQEATARDLK